jgi:hypothetical protein
MNHSAKIAFALASLVLACGDEDNNPSDVAGPGDMVSGEIRGQIVAE